MDIPSYNYILYPFLYIHHKFVFCSVRPEKNYLHLSFYKFLFLCLGIEHFVIKIWAGSRLMQKLYLREG